MKGPVTVRDVQRWQVDHALKGRRIEECVYVRKDRISFRMDDGRYLVIGVTKEGGMFLRRERDIYAVPTAPGESDAAP